MHHMTVIYRAGQVIVVMAASMMVLPLGPIAAHANFSIAATSPPAVPSTPLPLRNAWARSAYPLAIGFGKAIPLGFALRQIVPHGVLVVIRDGVRTSTIVSWHGGVPWNIALQRALAAAGLRAKITPVEVEIGNR